MNFTSPSRRCPAVIIDRVLSALGACVCACTYNRQLLLIFDTHTPASSFLFRIVLRSLIHLTSFEFIIPMVPRKALSPSSGVVDLTTDDNSSSPITPTMSYRQALLTPPRSPRTTPPSDSSSPPPLTVESYPSLPSSPIASILPPPPPVEPSLSKNAKFLELGSSTTRHHPRPKKRNASP